MAMVPPGKGFEPGGLAAAAIGAHHVHLNAAGYVRARTGSRRCSSNSGEVADRD